MRNLSSTTSTRSRSVPTPCCSKVGIKKGPWTPEEDELLANYVRKEGEGRWRTLPKRAGLLRCGKSCRLRWMNYLRPSVKRGRIAPDEEDLILRLHRLLGNRWSMIAGRIPGRTDNEIKNYWNTCREFRPASMVASHAFLSTMVVVKLAKLLQQRWLPTSSLLQQWWLPKSMVVATICCTCNGNKPNNTCLSKKLVSQGIDPRTHKPLKPNPDSSEIANVPVQNSNPKSSPVDENGRVYRTLATRVSENFTVTTNLDQSPNQAAADATENWPNRDGFNMGSLQSGYGRKNEDDFIEDIGNEDTFSSFLDSLLNENVFVYQQRQQLQQQNMLGPSSKLAVSSSQLLSHANVWEAEVSPPMAALGDKGVGGASNRLPV